MPDNLIEGYKWRSVQFDISRSQEMSKTSYSVQARDLAPSVWVATFETIPVPRPLARAHKARMDALRGSIGTFHASVVEAPRPVAIPTGSLAGVTIASIAANRNSLALSGLPAGAVISVGDYLTVVTAGGVELLEAVSAVTASGTGTTGQIALTTPARVSILSGASVILDGPYMEARLLPGTLERRQVTLTHDVVSFSAIQVVR